MPSSGNPDFWAGPYTAAWWEGIGEPMRNWFIERYLWHPESVSRGMLLFMETANIQGAELSYTGRTTSHLALAGRKESK